MTKQKVAIIGAGYGGLALANILAKAGYAVTVYEKHSTPGGRAGHLEQDGFSFDTGPSWYLMPEIFDHYYELFGKRASNELKLTRLSPGYKVFFEHDQPIEVSGDIDADAELFESYEKGAGEALKMYVASSAQTYTLAVRHFLYSNFERTVEFLNPEVLRHAARMLRLALRPLHSYVSRTVADVRLQKMLEYHMVFLGTSPFQAPALYSLMSNLDFMSGVYYPMGGMYRLIESMVEIGQELGVTYVYDAEVARIVVNQGEAVGIELASGVRVDADIVVSNSDLHHTEMKLVPEEYRSYPERYWNRREPGPGALLVMLGIKGELSMLRHHNLLFVDDWRGNFRAIYEDKEIPEAASLYVCNPSKTDPGVAPTGTENLFMLVPMPAGVILSEDEQAHHVDKFIAQFAQMIKVPNLMERIITKAVVGPQDFLTQYYSWQANALGGQSHILWQSAMFRTPNKSKRVTNLYYVGASTTPGIGLPMCLIGAELVYKRIKGDKHSGPIERIEMET